jgi:hypothetical protein
MGHQPAASALALGLKTQDLTVELHIGHRAVDFRNAVRAAAVDVLVGEIVEQVAHGADAELLVEKFGTPGAHART